MDTKPIIENPINLYPLKPYMWAIGTRKVGRIVFAVEVTRSNVKEVRKFIQEAYEKGITRRQYKTLYFKELDHVCFTDSLGLGILLLIGNFLILDADESTQNMADADLTLTKLEGDLAKTRLRPVEF